jgi:hypothetical protein
MAYAGLPHVGVRDFPGKCPCVRQLSSRVDLILTCLHLNKSHPEMMIDVLCWFSFKSEENSKQKCYQMTFIGKVTNPFIGKVMNFWVNQYLRVEQFYLT